MQTGHILADSSFSAIVNAPIEKIDIPAWNFTLPEHEYQAASPAHISAGFTTSTDGKRMSLNVETIGGSLMVQHYVEQLAEPAHLILHSVSDVFTPNGRTTIQVHWELSVKKIDNHRTEFTNRVQTKPTPELLTFIDRLGIPFEVFKTQRQPFSIYHNQSETPLLAKSIERHALQQVI